MLIRQLARRLVPEVLRAARRSWIQRRQWRDFGRLSPKEAFDRIYVEGVWGRSAASDQPFYSGSGSHAPSIVEPYVEAVVRFLRSLPEKPDVVDLGCGDFAVGSRVRPYCRRYIACDVVPSLVEFNRHRFSDLEVEFRSLDITSDEWPHAEVAFLRQVLQHLSNTQIHAVLRKLVPRHRHLVVTEHLPDRPGFVPNLDKPIGPHTRLDSGGPPSGVVLTEPPFSLKPVHSEVLCEARDYLGFIRTTHYTLT